MDIQQPRWACSVNFARTSAQHVSPRDTRNIRAKMLCRRAIGVIDFSRPLPQAALIIFTWLIYIKKRSSIPLWEFAYSFVLSTANWACLSSKKRKRDIKSANKSNKKQAWYWNLRDARCWACGEFTYRFNKSRFQRADYSDWRQNSGAREQPICFYNYMSTSVSRGTIFGNVGNLIWI